jgi:hypothetical protein
MLHVSDITLFTVEHILIFYTSADRDKNPARVYIEESLECKYLPAVIQHIIIRNSA